MKPIRNSAKALIIADGHLLVLALRDEEGVYFTLPGGGQEPGETLAEAVRRECREELAVEVLVQDLRFVREYIGRNHEFAATDGDVHQLDFMFACTLPPGTAPGAGALPDSGQLGFAWLPIAGLEAQRLYPKGLRALLGGDGRGAGLVYLGDMN